MLPFCQTLNKGWIQTTMKKLLVSKKFDIISKRKKILGWDPYLTTVMVLHLAALSHRSPSNTYSLVLCTCCPPSSLMSLSPTALTQYPTPLVPAQIPREGGLLKLKLGSITGRSEAALEHGWGLGKEIWRVLWPFRVLCYCLDTRWHCCASTLHPACYLLQSFIWLQWLCVFMGILIFFSQILQTCIFSLVIYGRSVRLQIVGNPDHEELW